MSRYQRVKEWGVAFLLGYGVGFVFWLAMIAASAIGGAVTDQPTEPVAKQEVKHGN